LSLLHRVVEACPDALQAFRTEFLDAPDKFFLESSVVRPGLSRFSFMGDAGGPLGEVITYDMHAQEATITRAGTRAVMAVDSVFDLLKARLAEMQLDCPPDLPFAFNLGYVGFLGYELKGETIGSKAHRAGTHDAAFILATRLIAFDHVERRCHLLHLQTDAASAAQAQAWFDATAHRLQSAPADTARRQGPPPPPPIRLALPDVERWIARHARMRHDKAAYIERIEDALREIVDGGTYEVCLANMVEFTLEDSPFELYRAMRQLTPAPHAAYFACGDFHLLSSSPERCVRVDRQRQVEARPIKGTRPRGSTWAEDLAHAEQLRDSEKDRAENLLVVDLLRSELGQVCELGSVHVPRLFDLETYSHVHQLVSTVRGQLKPRMSVVDCVRAVFPGGSTTGAPKKRTMEIIDRLEEGPRGSYCGVLGWLSLGGACDFNVVIRSIAVEGRRARFGIGGAITALSDPEDEFVETMVKARGLVEAVECLRRAQA
jgi:para-aminobenzoate synthetase